MSRHRVMISNKILFNISDLQKNWNYVPSIFFWFPSWSQRWSILLKFCRKRVLHLWGLLVFLLFILILSRISCNCYSQLFPHMKQMGLRWGIPRYLSNAIVTLSMHMFTRCGYKEHKWMESFEQSWIRYGRVGWVLSAAKTFTEICEQNKTDQKIFSSFQQTYSAMKLILRISTK